MLLQEAVSQDGHGGEADVVHRQIGRVIQGLGKMGAGGESEGYEDLVRRKGLISQTGPNSYTHHHTSTCIQFKQAYNG